VCVTVHASVCDGGSFKNLVAGGTGNSGEKRSYRCKCKGAFFFVRTRSCVKE
jgi:hypothetical protein